MMIQGNLRSADLQNAISMILDQGGNTLSADEKQKITSAITKLYVGLTLVHWAKKDTKLGTARQSALNQMQEYVNSKTDLSNPTIKYMRTKFSELKTAIAQSIMTSKNSDRVVEPEKFTEFIKSGNQYANDAFGIIATMVAKFKQTQKDGKTQQMQQANKNLQIAMIMQSLIEQRTRKRA